MPRSRLVLAVAALCVGLTGCAAESHAPEGSDPPAPYLTPIPTVSTPTPTPTPVGVGVAGGISAAVFDAGMYLSTQPSGYSSSGQKGDAFPAGTRVIAVKFSVEGFKPFGQPDVSAFTMADTKFAGKSERAVLDTNEGPAYAAAQGLPWLLDGVFANQSKPWLLTNNTQVYFLAAWHVPANVNELTLSISPTPSAPPILLTVPLPGE